MNKVKSFIKRRFLRFKFSSEYFFYKKPKNFEHLLKMDNTELYSSMFLFFHKHLNKDIKKLRGYFNSNFRGFGEDAFFSVWFYVFNHKKPKNILEIGVYRGQSLALFQLLSEKNNINSDIYGISPLTNLGDEYSEYLDIDYETDILNNFKALNLKKPNLIKGLSQEEKIVKFIQSIKWDLIYIDGSHDFFDVKKDLTLAIENLNTGGLIAVDDSNKDKDYNYQLIQNKYGILSSDGHDGPTRALTEILSTRSDIKILLSIGHLNFLSKIK